MADAVPLAVSALSAGYGLGKAGSDTRLVVEGVSFEVHAGELVAILGPNGAGKSTLLRALAGTHPIASGEVSLLGTKVSGLERRTIAQKLAVVPQTEEIAFGFTVREVVMMGRAPHQGGWMRPSADDDRVVDLALERCELKAFAHRPARALSGGEQKRVHIARALAQAPRVLLLDEPGAFLDVKYQVALYDLLADEIARERIACVVVMHDLNIAAQYASRVLLLKAGKLVAIGGVEEVMTYALLRQTFDTDLYAGLNELTNTRFFLPMRTRPKAPA
jgi:iron complex transport system ATP-binding protein